MPAMPPPTTSADCFSPTWRASSGTCQATRRTAAATKDDDFIERMFVAHSHDYLLCFSNRGRLYWLKVFEVPQGGSNSRGKPVVNMFPLEDGEKITAVVPVKEFDENHFVFMATSQGTVKKTPLAEFSRPRPSGIIAVGLDEGDYLVGAALTGIAGGRPVRDAARDATLFAEGTDLDVLLKIRDVDLSVLLRSQRRIPLPPPPAVAFTRTG